MCKPKEDLPGFFGKDVRWGDQTKMNWRLQVGGEKGNKGGVDFQFFGRAMEEKDRGFWFAGGTRSDSQGRSGAKGGARRKK